MRVNELHDWDLSPKEAIALQRDLRKKVVTRNALGPVHTVAGVDVSTAKSRARAAIVVLRISDLQPLEAARAECPLTYPYIPGLLSFREAPAILTAVERLKAPPDLFIFDGQGLAHPRCMGIACHVGVIIDQPCIGCAKSRLVGEHGQVGPNVGDYSELQYQGETVGSVLRTRKGVKPVYISVGHKVDLEAAISYILRCGSGYRLPEPIRWAHKVAGGAKLPNEP
jgi:deoxyribonuclease V